MESNKKIYCVYCEGDYLGDYDGSQIKLIYLSKYLITITELSEEIQGALGELLSMSRIKENLKENEIKMLKQLLSENVERLNKYSMYFRTYNSIKFSDVFITENNKMFNALGFRVIEKGEEY